MDKILDAMKQFAQKNKIPIIMDDTVDFLQILMMAIRPETILEIGTAIGYSSIIMSQTLAEGGRIDTIEVNPDMVDKAWGNINDAGLSDVIRIIEGDAGEVLPSLNEEYDMIFLDAAKSRYVEFLPHCVRLIKRNGLIIADNILYKDMTKGPERVRHKQRTAVTKLRGFLEQIENYPQLKTTLINVGDGVTISVKL